MILRTAIKNRPNGTRKFILGILALLTFMNLERGSSMYLFVAKVFGWEPTQFANYMSVAISFYAVRTFLITPLYSYVFGVHDCMLSAVASLCEAAGYIVKVSGYWKIFSLSFIHGVNN